MNTELPLSLLITAFTGALMALLPHLSPRQYFFAITVEPGFRSSRGGRASIRRYQAWVLAAVVLAAVAAATLGDQWPGAAFVLAPVLPLVIGIGAFLRERARVIQHAAKPSGVREARLTPDADHLPHWIWMALPPFLAPPTAAAWLRAHWNAIPERFPIHWNASNQADAWAAKTTLAVYGPLLCGVGMMLLMLLLALAMFHGARRGPQRLVVLKILLGCVYMLAVVFTAISLLPVLAIPPLWLLAPVGLYLPAAIWWAWKAAQDPDMQIDKTPDDCWYLGMFYCNRQDPAIFVQKRMGFGYTFNMANPLALVLVVLLIGGIVSLNVFLP